MRHGERDRRRHVLAAAVVLVVSALAITQVPMPVSAAVRPRHRAEPMLRRGGARSRRVQEERIVTPALPTLSFDPEAPVRERIAAAVAWRLDVYESPARPVAAGLLRRQLAGTFARELAVAGESAPHLLDALETASSPRSWNHLRGELGRSPARAARATELLLRSILAEAAPPVGAAVTGRLRR